MKSHLAMLALVLLSWPGSSSPAQAAPAKSGTFTPAGGPQGERREVLMRRLENDPYPKNGAWYFVSQAFGSYWTGDDKKGDEAIAGLQKLVSDSKSKPAPEQASASDTGFHWQAYQIARLILLFGHEGMYAPGRMSAEAESTAKEILWKWLVTRAGAALVDPSRDWWVWGSENHHLQMWFSMWGCMRIFASDPAYANRSFADGTTPAQLKKPFDEYFKRWIRNRATRGLLVECGSPTYAKYSTGGFYNFVDFSDDPELQRLAHQFLDVLWSQWALEQIDGIRAGSRHRSYHGLPSIEEGADGDIAWYHFGVGSPKSAHPAVLCAATSGYTPPALAQKIASDRPSLGNYEIISRQPGFADPKTQRTEGYATDPKAPLYEKTGAYKLDSLCRSMLRVTYATPQFILGNTMIPALPPGAWTAISSQNRWDGVIFTGPGSPRIFMQPQTTAKGSIYNAQWSVQSKGVMIIQRLPAKDAMGPWIWFSHSLTRTENKGWIFVEAPDAWAAVKVSSGGWTWEPDQAAFYHTPKGFNPGEGEWLVSKDQAAPVIMEVVPKSAYPDFAAFQTAILANRLEQTPDRLAYTSSFYKTTLTFFPVSKQPPLINGVPVNYEAPESFSGPMLQSDFGGKAVTLHAFGQSQAFGF